MPLGYRGGGERVIKKEEINRGERKKERERERERERENGRERNK